MNDARRYNIIWEKKKPLVSCSENGSIWMVPPNLGPPKKYKVKIILFLIDYENMETHIDFAAEMQRKHITISFI